MKNFTVIPNELLGPTQLPVSSKYLLCVLLKYCGQDDYCFPSQTTLANDLGHTDRQIRNLLNNLETEGLIHSTRKGFNKPNTYKVAKSFILSPPDRKSVSYQLGSKFPLNQGSGFPPKSTYLKAKDKRNLKRIEQLRKQIYAMGLKKKSA